MKPNQCLMCVKQVHVKMLDLEGSLESHFFPDHGILWRLGQKPLDLQTCIQFGAKG